VVSARESYIGTSKAMVRFGVCVAQDGVRFEELKERILQAERLGFDSFWLFDHLTGFPFPDHQTFFESWTTLSALSALTNRIRVGTLVTNVQYRHPPMVAKMAATLDVISGGRLELGLGAGGTVRADWDKKLGYSPEYVAYGTSFSEKPSMRIRRLDEAAKIIKLMWTEKQATFSGNYYKIKNVVCDPKPVQKPHPRIWIAGGGEMLLLRVAAKHANGTNFAWNLAPVEFNNKVTVLKKHCEVVGTNFANIVKSLSVGALIADDERNVNTMREKLMKIYDGLDGYLPYALRKSGLVGSPGQCGEKVKEFVDAGVQYFMIVFADVPQMRLFAEKVLPRFC